MSDEREQKAGRQADDTADEEVKLHVKIGRQADDTTGDAEGDDVEAHVKSARSMSGDDDEGDGVEAHVKSGR